MCIKLGCVLAVLAIGVASAAVSRHTRGVICGSQLSEALSLACGSNYYFPRDSRAFSSDSLKSSVALSFLGRHRRQHRGIVEECCHKSCSMQELLAYCGK